MSTYPIALNARAWQWMAEYYRRHNTAASTPKPVVHDMELAQEDVDRHGIPYAVAWEGKDEGVFG